MKTKIKKPTKRIILLIAVSLILFSATVNGQWTKHYIDENLDGANVVSIADINADNNPDVVAGGYYAFDLVWYEAPSWNKNFIDPILPKSPTDLAVTDMDGDNDLDVVVALDFQGVSQILWFEAPSWTKYNITGLSSGNIYNKLAVADLNDDDIPDVVSADYENDRVLWFEGPSWIAHFIDTGLNDPFDVFVADMDGDDDPDVVAIGSQENYIVWYEAPSWTKHFIEDNLDDIRCITIADLNNDDLPDVCAATNYANTDVVVWYEAPDWTRHYIDNNRTNSSDICVADLNNDNIPDVLLTGGNSDNIVWYEAPSWIKHVVDDDVIRPGNVDVADMDGDDDIDIVVAAGTFDKVIWYENGLIIGLNSYADEYHSFSLSNNYPNPFKTSTVISYDLNTDREVKLEVLDVYGRKINTLVHKQQTTGNYQIEFNATGLASGIYYYRLTVGQYAQTKKLIIQK